MKTLLLAVLLFLFTPAVASADLPNNVPHSNAWAVQHQPAAATAATITQAAKTGYKHVATSITVCIQATAAQTSVVFNLRDGTTGAGTILWSARLMGVIGTGQCVTSGPVVIPGTVSTAMTLESASAPAATNFATVSLAGYDILPGR